MSSEACTTNSEVLVGEGGPSGLGWSQISSFLRCAKEFQLQHIRGLRIPTAVEPDPLGTGTLVHAGRAKMFGSMFTATLDEVRLAMQEAAESNRLPMTREAIALSEQLMAGYYEHWMPRPRPRPVAVEHLIGPVSVDGIDGADRTARLDDVSVYPESGGRLAIGEAKTTSSLKDCINQYTLHGQPVLQRILWKAATQGAPMLGDVAGVVLDVIQKPRSGKMQFARQFLPVTDYVLQWAQRSLAAYVRAAGLLDWNSDAPRNIEACTRTGNFGRIACPFRELCMWGRGAASQFVLKDGRIATEWRPSEGQEVPPWM